MAKGEDPHWMEKAFSKNKGKLHRKLHVKQGQKIPASKLAKAKHASDPEERKEANLAAISKRYGKHGKGRTSHKRTSRGRGKRSTKR